MNQLASYIEHHWLRLICLLLAIFVGLTWLAPLFAALQLWDLADALYTAYALQCHQLPERAGRLFGYEVASCFRCNSLYGGMVIFGLLYGLARGRKVVWLRWLRKSLPWWLFLLFLLPLLIDGITHMLGLRTPAVGGIAQASFGSFYVGAQAFSLNWWLRILTGGIAGLGAVWFAFPRIDRALGEAAALRLRFNADFINGQ